MRSPNDWLIDESDESVPASTPSFELSDEDVEHTDWDYSDRAPGDWVVSGPLGEEGRGNGRWFPSWKAAERWAREFYGERFKRRVPEAAQFGARWAFLIRGSE